MASKSFFDISSLISFPVYDEVNVTENFVFIWNK